MGPGPGATTRHSPAAGPPGTGRSGPAPLTAPGPDRRGRQPRRDCGAAGLAETREASGEGRGSGDALNSPSPPTYSTFKYWPSRAGGSGLARRTHVEASGAAG